MPAPARPRGGAPRLIVALDLADATAAAALARRLSSHVALVKLGLEFFCACGPDGVRRVADAGVPVFLDLKLHDIPNTVAGAVRSLGALRPAMLTLHAGGGRAMLEAAREAAGDDGPLLLAVSVLTSLSDAALAETGVAEGAADQVLRLARLAAGCGMGGLVCSPAEIGRVRTALGDRLALVVPGIRPADSARDDQARTATAADALRAGADWLVVGRPITAAADPVAAARALSEAA
jgi:orotidine-5'-phosphate decarboxylase